MKRNQRGCGGVPRRTNRSRKGAARLKRRCALRNGIKHRPNRSRKGAARLKRGIHALALDTPRDLTAPERGRHD